MYLSEKEGQQGGFCVNFKWVISKENSQFGCCTGVTWKNISKVVFPSVAMHFISTVAFKLKPSGVGGGTH